MNKRKSPQTTRNKSPPSEITSHLRTPHAGFVYPPTSKNDLFSSNQESTQQEKAINPGSQEYPCYLGESVSYNNVEKAFMKTKKEKERDEWDNKYSRGLTSSNEGEMSSSNRNALTRSDKNINYQKSLLSNLGQKQKKNSNERYHDYFDNKIYALRGVKSKPKMQIYEKLSDSGESAGSFNSGYSVQSEGGQIKTFAPRKYQNLAVKKQQREKTGEDLLLFSKYQNPAETRNKFSNNVFRPNYMSPPVLSKDSTYEFDNSQDFLQKKYSPHSKDQRNKLPAIVDNILKKKSEKSFVAKEKNLPHQSNFHETELSKKRTSITPNKLQDQHYSPSPKEKQFSRPMDPAQIQTNVEALNGISPIRRVSSIKQSNSYTPQYKGHAYQKSDGPLTPPIYHSDKKNKGWEDDQFDQSFLIRGSSHLYSSSRKVQIDQSNFNTSQMHVERRKRTSHLSSVISIEGRTENSRISSFSSNLNNNDISQTSKFKTNTLFPFTRNNTLQPFDFKIIKKLAENRNSATFQCLQPSTRMLYCLKKTNITEDNMKEIALQYKVGSKLNHPNLVKSFCSFYDRSSVYLLMQYMEGGTLLERKVQKQEDFQVPVSKKSHLYSPHKLNRATSKDQLPNKQLTQRLKSEQKVVKKHRIISTLKECVLQQTKDKGRIVKDILQQILEGVAYLHRRNIWHRDLKPDNIFISHGSYKIGDFGSSCFNNNQDHVGTLDYAAPEIMLKTSFTQSIDIWSLGCIAYELQVGFTPFFDANRNQTVRRIVNVEYDRSLVRNEQLSDLISRMLVRNGGRRISAEEALNHGYFKQTHVQSRMRI